MKNRNLGRLAVPIGVVGIILLLVVPFLNQGFFSIVYWFFDLSGVSSFLVSAGGQLTRFWSAWF